MKRTLTINLNNTVFHIDDDAYELLQSYLQEVGNHFKSESEKADIMNDIEARIAELFTEKMDRQKNVVTIEDVDSVVTVMGKPSQFVEGEEEDSRSNRTSDANSEQAKSRTAKKYYRNSNNRLLGGVASGLAVYLKCDTALVRVIFVLLAFLTSGTFILIYLLMWIIIPKAVTTAQKLEMQGEDVNILTIKNRMIEAKDYIESDKFKEGATEVGGRIWKVLRTILKFVLSIVGAIISIVGVILIAALIFGLIVFLLEPEAITSIYPEFFVVLGDGTPDKIILLIISLLLIIGAPIFALINWSLNTISKPKNERPKSSLIVALILWLAGIFIFVGSGATALRQLRESNLLSYDKNFEWKWNGENRYEDILKNSDYVTENRILSSFSAIDVSNGIKLELTQQDKQSLALSTLPEYTTNVKTEVVDGVLKIYTTDKLIRPQIKVKIGIDSLSALKLSGASKIDFMNPFNVKKLDIQLSGASKSDVKLSSAQKLVIDISGSSKLDIEGFADSLQVNGGGASNLSADELKTRYVKMKLSGASNADVYASEEFDGDLSGASNVSVGGSPKRVSKQISGSSVIKLD